MLRRAVMWGVFLWAGPALATTYQVGAARTWKQLNQAVGKVAPGDVVEIDGNAMYSAVRWTTSGTAAQPIRLVGLRVDGVRPRFQGGTNTMEIEADHVVVEGVDLTGGSSRCFYHHGDDLTLRDSVVHDCPSQGVLGGDTDSGSLLMEYVEIHHCGNGEYSHQIYMATDEVAHPGSVFRMQYCYLHDANGGNNVQTRAERNEIYFNWIEGAMYHELELVGPDPGGAPDGWTVDLKREDSDVVGNVLRKTKASFVVRIGGDGAGWTKGRYRFVNNTIITMSSDAVFRFFDQIESVEMHNNAFIASGSAAPNLIRAASGEFTWVNGMNIAGSNNWVSKGATNAPAQWTATLTGASPDVMNVMTDPRPTATSPLRDAGAASPMGPAGFAFPRPMWPPSFHPPLRALLAVGAATPRGSDSAIDIGAFEMGGTVAGSGGTTGTGGGGVGGAAGNSAGSGGLKGTGGIAAGGAGGTGQAGGRPGGTGGQIGGSDGGSDGGNDGGGAGMGMGGSPSSGSGATNSGGCGCAVATDGTSGVAAGVVVLAGRLALRLRRRRRSRNPLGA